MLQKTPGIKTNHIFWINAVLGISMLCAYGSSVYANYNVLWDTSHGNYDPFDYTPSGRYQLLVQNLASNGFNVDATDQGFLAENTSAYDVLVVGLGTAWDTAYSAAEVSHISDFVNNGGGLLIMGDNLDTPNENIQPVASAFGVSLEVSNISPYDTYISNLDYHPIFEGVSEIYMRAAGEISSSVFLDEIAWQTDTDKALVAAGSYGNGRVVVLGDWSTWEQASTSNTYYQNADNELFSINTFEYLAIPEPITCLLLGLGSLLIRIKKV